MFLFFSFLYDGEALHAASHTAASLKRAREERSFSKIQTCVQNCIGSFEMHGQLCS